MDGCGLGGERLYRFVRGAVVPFPDGGGGVGKWCCMRGGGELTWGLSWWGPADIKRWVDQ